MANGKAETKRKTLTLTTITLRYLEKLAEGGIHGSDWSGVARGFVEEGVRRAIKEGFIDNSDGQE